MNFFAKMAVGELTYFTDDVTFFLLQASETK